MKATHVSLLPAVAAANAGRPSLTPELLAASGARYSRNNEGLDSILSKIDPNNLDKSVDSIFRMIDYGHQSIADMVPIAMFIDDVSILLAYIIWALCPTASGQESSTRYIKLRLDSLVDPTDLGVPDEEKSDWYAFMGQCFEAYENSVAFWEGVATANPEVTLIPSSILNDPSDKSQKQVARMKRNYAFDRARYFLPVAAKTNLMLIMSARGWIQLNQQLFSHWLPEARKLALLIHGELKLVAPRLIKHSEPKASFTKGLALELADLVGMAGKRSQKTQGEVNCVAQTALFLPQGITDDELASSLAAHDNRYGYIGEASRRTAVRFSWSAVAIAEIRDLNRHRTGQKYCPLLPQGFYCAEDKIPPLASAESLPRNVGDVATGKACSSLSNGFPGFAAWTLLGTQYSFEHVTTLDKYIYEAELRTGTGAHFRYAKHLRDSVEALRLSYPRTAEAIQLGSAEPE